MAAACAEAHEEPLLTASQALMLERLAETAGTGTWTLGELAAFPNGEAEVGLRLIADDGFFDILDYDSCFARWGCGLKLAGHGDKRLQEIRECTQLRWEWLGRFYELSGNTTAEIHGLVSQLDELEGQCLEVARRTAGLRESCEWRVREQERMSDFTENVAQRLEAFGDVGEIARALEKSAVLASPSMFETTLDRIEHAATYMAMHHDFSGAEECIHQLEHLRGRACILARAAVQRCLERSAAQVEQELWEESQQDAVDTEVFHAPFRAAAPSCRPVATLLYRRMSTHRVYAATFEELEGIHAATRERLILGAVTAHLATLLEMQPDLPPTVHQASAYVLDAERVERELFGALFELRQPQVALDGLLGKLGAALSRALRPAVLGCTSLDALREAAESIQVDFLEPRQHAADRGAAAPPPSPVATAVGRLHTDLREQLVLQARARIARGVVNHRPVDAELDYPRVCWGGGDAHGGVGASSPGCHRSEYQRGWFPTLNCTLGTLAKTYRVLEPAAFACLARDAACACVASLRRAAALLAERPLVQPLHALGVLTRAMDAQLFLVKHLLILREQVASFECGSPAAGNAHADAAKFRAAQAEMNREIEVHLDAACSAFAAEVAGWAARPLTVLAARFHQAHGGGRFIMEGQSREAAGAFLSNLRSAVPSTVALMRVYLDGPGDASPVGEARKSTVALFPLLQARVLECWDRLFAYVTGELAAGAAAGAASAAAPAWRPSPPLAGLPTAQALTSLLGELLEDGLQRTWEQALDTVSQVPRSRRQLPSSGPGPAALTKEVGAAQVFAPQPRGMPVAAAACSGGAAATAPGVAAH